MRGGEGRRIKKIDHRQPITSKRSVASFELIVSSSTTSVIIDMCCHFLAKACGYIPVYMYKKMIKYCHDNINIKDKWSF